MSVALSLVRGVERDFSQIGDGHYRLGVPSLGIMLDVDRLRREQHTLVGELAVYSDIAGGKKINDAGAIHVADFNLSSADARVKRANLLGQASNAPDVDWRALLEELAVKTITAEREGSPARVLSQYEKPGIDALFHVDGWPILRDHATIGFGDGGSLKSYLALYGAGTLSRAGVNVLYCDWELDGTDHRDRLERLFGAEMPLVHYLRCDRPLVVEADRIAREVRRLSIDFAIYDSIAFATGGPPEAAEHATAYFRAVRQIGVGSLHLAHINKSDSGDQKPFGSSFWHNSARATWFVKQASASADGDRVQIGLFNRKSNLTRLHPAVGFQFDFEADAVAVSRVNLADVEDLAGNLPLWQRMRHLLRSGAQPIHAIAKELGAKENSVTQAVNRGKGKVFTMMLSSDGIQRVGLLERQAVNG
jgi:hypothetical protein